MSKLQDYIDTDSIPIYSKWNKFTGSIIATSILSTLYQHFLVSNDPLCRSEDEWLNALNIGRSKFLDNRGRIGRKLAKGEELHNAFKEGCLIVWDVFEFKTYYWLNVDLLAEKLSEVYGE